MTTHDTEGGILMNLSFHLKLFGGYTRLPRIEHITVGFTNDPLRYQLPAFSDDEANPFLELDCFLLLHFVE